MVTCIDFIKKSFALVYQFFNCEQLDVNFFIIIFLLIFNVCVWLSDTYSMLLSNFVLILKAKKNKLTFLYCLKSGHLIIFCL